MALVPAILQAAFGLPGLGPALRAVEGMVEVIGWYFERVMADPNTADSLQLQADLEARLEVALQVALVPTQEAALVAALAER